MALPEDFNKIFGSTATGGLTPIGDVNYAKGWEFVGSNPPTKNDFSYLQNLSDLKSQWLYSNKLQRTEPFGDIKSDGTVSTALENLGLGASAFGYKNMTVFSSAGVSQWTVPDEIKAGRKCLVEVYGGGASGGRSAAGGGGGAGGVAIKLLTLTGVDSVTVTVGAGGAAAAIDTTVVSGNSGGTSSFGSYLSATGGGGSISSGGTGGTGTGGDINTSLGSGCAGSSFGADYSSGSGGGPGGSGSIASQRRDGVDARGPGGGGSGSAIGSSGIAAKPGKGNPGMVVIRW